MNAPMARREAGGRSKHSRPLPAPYGPGRSPNPTPSQTDLPSVRRSRTANSSEQLRTAPALSAVANHAGLAVARIVKIAVRMRRFFRSVPTRPFEGEN